MSESTRAPLNFRDARESDVALILAMLAADPVSAAREEISDPLPQCYTEAFRVIESDANNELIIVEHQGEVAGTLQLTYIPNITRKGSWRALLEGVHIAEKFQGKGIGTRMIEWAISRSRERGCALIQLTTDKRRTDALRFYERLGFKASHEGMKLDLSR